MCCRTTIAQLSLNTELCSEFPRVLANLEMSRAVPIIQKLGPLPDGRAMQFRAKWLMAP